MESVVGSGEQDLEKLGVNDLDIVSSEGQLKDKVRFQGEPSLRAVAFRARAASLTFIPGLALEESLGDFFPVCFLSRCFSVVSVRLMLPS